MNLWLIRYLFPILFVLINLTKSELLVKLLCSDSQCKTPIGSGRLLKSAHEFPLGTELKILGKSTDPSKNVMKILIGERNLLIDASLIDELSSLETSKLIQTNHPFESVGVDQSDNRPNSGTAEIPSMETNEKIVKKQVNEIDSDLPAPVSSPTEVDRPDNGVSLELNSQSPPKSPEQTDESSANSKVSDSVVSEGNVQVNRVKKDELAQQDTTQNLKVNVETEYAKPNPTQGHADLKGVADKPENPTNSFVPGQDSGVLNQQTNSKLTEPDLHEHLENSSGSVTESSTSKQSVADTSGAPIISSVQPDVQVPDSKQLTPKEPDVHSADSRTDRAAGVKVTPEVHTRESSASKVPPTSPTATPSKDTVKSKVPVQVEKDLQQRTASHPNERSTVPVTSEPTLNNIPDTSTDNVPEDRSSSESSSSQSDRAVNNSKSMTDSIPSKEAAAGDTSVPSNDPPKPGVVYQSQSEQKPVHDKPHVQPQPSSDKIVEARLSQGVDLPSSQPETHSDVTTDTDSFIPRSPPINLPESGNTQQTVDDSKQTTLNHPKEQVNIPSVKEGDSTKVHNLPHNLQENDSQIKFTTPKPALINESTLPLSDLPKSEIANQNFQNDVKMQSKHQTTEVFESIPLPKSEPTVTTPSSTSDTFQFETEKPTPNDIEPKFTPDPGDHSLESSSAESSKDTAESVPESPPTHPHATPNYHGPDEPSPTSNLVQNEEDGVSMTSTSSDSSSSVDLHKSDASLQQPEELNSTESSSHNQVSSASLEPSSSIKFPINHDSNQIPTHLGLIQCLAVAAQLDKDLSESQLRANYSPLSRLVMHIILYFQSLVTRLIRLLPTQWIHEIDHFLIDWISVRADFLVGWIILILHLLVVHNVVKLLHSGWNKLRCLNSSPQLKLMESEELIIQLTNQLHDQQENNNQLSEWSIRLNQDLEQLREEYNLKTAEISLTLRQTNQLYEENQYELNQLKKVHADLENQSSLTISERDNLCEQLKLKIDQLENQLEEMNHEWQDKLTETDKKHNQTIKDLELEQEQLFNQANNYYNRMKTMQTEVDKIVNSRNQVEQKLERTEAELQSLLMTFNTLKSFEMALDKIQNKSGNEIETDLIDNSSFTMIGIQNTHSDNEDDDDNNKAIHDTIPDTPDEDGTVTTNENHETDEKNSQDSVKQDRELVKIKENLSLFLDVGRLQAQINLKDEQIRNQERKLQYEQDLRQSLETQFELAEKENSDLRSLKTNLEQEKLGIETKLEVLTNYFKERELELQRDLGRQVVVGSESSEALTNTLRRNEELENEVKVLRDQLASTRKLMSEMERTNHRKISELDKRSHENWLAARSSDHRVKELQEELASLRLKLAECQRNLLPPALRSLPGSSGIPPQGNVPFSRPNLPSAVSPNPKFDNRHSLSRQSLNSLSSQRSGLPEMPFIPPPLPPPGMIPPPPGTVPIPPSAFGSARIPFSRAGFVPPPPPPPPPGLMMPPIRPTTNPYSGPSSVTGSSR